MKTKTFQRKENTYEVIVPFGGADAPDDGLFDDCPICQQLKKDLEEGKLEAVEDEDERE